MSTIYDFIGEHLVLTAILIIIIYFIFVFFLWPYLQKRGIIQEKEPTKETDDKQIIKKEEI